ncbi:MAG TPA: hypothetical protein VEA92_02705 [Candidatus Paceibacterota bacterium]|nr:hypothetical protein [Candidatus Paceibacterota bacterium]
MSWASRRKFAIIALIALIAVAVIASLTFAVIHETPTCTDGKLNGEETGVDCGGGCTYLCLNEVEEPVVRFVRPFSPQAGRYDVIAYIDNRNPSLAAKNVHATVELFDESRTLLGTKEATLDIPAGGTVPLYIPEAYRGDRIVSQAFLTLDESTLRFYVPDDRHRVPSVTGVETENSESPRITAEIENQTAYPMYDIRPIATVFDTAGNAIAASQTYLPQLGAYGQAHVLFTWNRAFPSPPARVEVLPVLPIREP